VSKPRLRQRRTQQRALSTSHTAIVQNRSARARQAVHRLRNLSEVRRTVVRRDMQNTLHTKTQESSAVQPKYSKTLHGRCRQQLSGVPPWCAGKGAFTVRKWWKQGKVWQKVIYLRMRQRSQGATAADMLESAGEAKKLGSAIIAVHWQLSDAEDLIPQSRQACDADRVQSLPYRVKQTAHARVLLKGRSTFTPGAFAARRLLLGAWHPLALSRAVPRRLRVKLFKELAEPAETYRTCVVSIERSIVSVINPTLH